MAFLKIENVAIRGISACVPPKVEENRDLPFYGPGEAEQVITATGIERRHVATADIAVSDLCFKAAEKLIEELGWEKDSIDVLALATQNADYVNHPTSFVVHERLGLPESTMCVDFFHGCPAWVVSLGNIASLLSNGVVKRAILLDGDTTSKNQRKLDRESRPLFGDACTATALEYCPGAPSILSNIGTKSEDGIAIANTLGGMRNPYTMETYKRRLDMLSGAIPPDPNADHMDSMDVFSFAITKVPKAIKKLCSEFELDIEEIDELVLHQANKMIVEAIAKRLKVPMEKVPLSLKNYGNTTSASVPLTIVSECAEEYRACKVKSLTCGFGTGLAWGAVYFETENMVVPNVIIY
jgi:3-oxoacyl-[acyl-carrier-protein] synthase-3